jgi:hypothetical protein
VSRSRRLPAGLGLGLGSTWQQLASTVVPLIDGLVATKAAVVGWF